MRHIIMTTALTILGGLFTAGLALGAGESHSGTSQWGSSSQMDKGQQQQYGSSSQAGQQQQMASQQLNREKVRELQKTLNDKGFAAGPVDGIVGPKTRNAIQSFQKQEGIAASGKPDKQTLDALDIEVGQQEFFGVSPEFGSEKQQNQTEEQKQQQQQQPQEQQQQEPFQQERQQGSGTMENR